MYLIKENDVYKRERERQFSLEEIITFKLPIETVYKKHDYDWYMTVALEKIDKIIQDRNLLTAELIINYRWAIREGYNHQLDKSLQSQYDYPKNHNSVKGVVNYIERIKKLSELEK